MRAPAASVTLGCGGAPLLGEGDPPPEDAALDPELAGGTLIGKRYLDEDRGVEVLCTRGGEGVLTCDGTPLVVQSAKPLPSSD